MAAVAAVPEPNGDELLLGQDLRELADGLAAVRQPQGPTAILPTLGPLNHARDLSRNLCDRGIGCSERKLVSKRRTDPHNFVL